MIRNKVFIILLLIGLVTVFGCDDRGTNVPTRSSREMGIDPNRNSPIANPALNFQVFNPEGLLQMAVYAPLEAFKTNAQPIPFLVLLAPENENKFYYTDHGLVELVEELIASGEIEPMAIAMVGNDQIFGGYFYANSFPGGNYDDVLGPALFRQLQGFIGFPILDAPNKRAIGGIGQGAYGAFRAAIMNPGYYGAVATGDGPLDFDGATGTGGIIPLFGDVFTEHGLAVNSPSIYTIFDSSFTRPVSQFILGGALAFSPHDTNITFDTVSQRDTVIGTDTFSFDIDYPITNNRNDPAFIITDSTTLVTSVLTGDISRNDFNFDFHLPFDSNASANSAIWPLWMANNLDALEAQNPGALSGTNCWIGTTTEGSFGPWKSYSDQTQSWITTLNSISVRSLSTANYKGYGGFPATRDEYIQDLMREMLIFADSSTFKK